MIALPLISTLADLTAAKLEAYYAPPAPFVATQSASNDPAQFMTDTYIKELNRSYMHHQVDSQNSQAFGNYQTAANNWQFYSNKPPTLPTPPQYQEMNDSEFDQWWALYQVAIGQGQDAPTPFFVYPMAPLPPPFIVTPIQPPAPAQPANPIGNPVASAPGFFYPAIGDQSLNGVTYQDASGKYAKLVSPFGAAVWQKVG